jgi:hypothetical protein
MILIGHSMGGLLAKMMVQSSGTAVWDRVARRPFGQLVGPSSARDLLREVVFFERLLEMRRVVFIATPHRGSRLSESPIGLLGERFTTLTGEARKDGVVPYRSAHLDGVASETFVVGGHLCQNHLDVIKEVRNPGGTSGGCGRGETDATVNTTSGPIPARGPRCPVADRLCDAPA